MNESLAFIVFLLMFCSIICLVIGVFNPLALVGLFQRKFSKKQASIIFGGTALGLFVVFCVLVVNSTPTNKPSTTAKATPQIKPTNIVSKTQQKENSAPAKKTPTPTTDPCENQIGTKFYATCVTSLETKNELSHPLKAKISHDAQALYITNTESTNWVECEVFVNDSDPQADNFGTSGFGFKILAGQTATISWASLVNNENQRFNYYQTQPSLIDLDCSVNGEIHRSRFNL